MSCESMAYSVPVANTFIQFTAPRSESLEEFLQPRSAFSCPASRLVSLEEDPRESAEPVIQWPATRGPSLDEEEEATKFASEVTVALHNTFMQPPAPQAPLPRWASIEDDEDLPEFMQTISKEEEVDTEVFQWPATRGPSLDEFAGDKMFLKLESAAAPPVAPAEGFMYWAAMEAKPFSMDESFVSDASTAVSRDEENSQTTPVSGLSDDEGDSQKDTSATLKISLTDTLGLWSIGSAAHETGNCKPCAFLWKDLKQPGCQNGSNCVFCHLCPPGEVKQRKKQKMFMRKVAKNLQYTNQFASGFDPQFDAQYQNQFAVDYGMW